MNPALKTTLAGLGLMLAGVIALPTSAALTIDSSRLEDQSAELIARKGGGGGGGGGRKGGGGGMKSGGGGARRAGGGGQTGFSKAGGGLNRGSAKPAGGWSNKANVGGGGGPSLNRPAAGNRAKNGSRSGGSGDRMANRDGNRDLNRDGNRNINRDVNRNVNRDVNRNINRDVNRNWNRDVNINNFNVSPGWARPGWGAARPWNSGWYGGWSTPTWGWWGARAATWGVASLATAAIINDAVDNAVSSNNTYIVVPNTNYQLLYGTVQPSGSNAVSFVMQADGSNYQLTANCNQGTINGQEPSNAEEAELLNAACQVAYGSV